VTDEPAKKNESGGHDRRRRVRRRTFGFVAVFVITVLALLTGYRYAIGTRLNDNYLYTVALHTTWVLDLIGDRAILEGAGRRIKDPQQVRAELAAWERGDDKPTKTEIAEASIEPLSSYEVYIHRLVERRRNEYRGSLGPHVAFIFRPGLQQQLIDVQRKLAELRTADSDVGAQIAALEVREESIEQDIAEAREAEDGRARMRGDKFSFIVVSECGAIEVMAIFFAAVLAFPALWSRRLIGIVVGVPMLYCVNIFRLCCLAMIGALDHSGEWFKFTHEYVWQAVYIVFVVMVWLAWVEYIVHRKSRKAR